MIKKSKAVIANEKHINVCKFMGRTECRKSELPHPNVASKCDGVLAVSGNRVIFTSSEAK